ncbi:oxidoreductase [Streptomyces sp. NEAU-174]|uniref:oxidoreductase n=1 Tax=Streptomyces sp. NEAU-174 TaxID=3458254 RepID=UPI004043C373
MVVGSSTLRNRLVATADASGFVRDGPPVGGDAEYWGRLAAGGAALLVCGGTTVAAETAPRQGNILQLHRPEAVQPLRRRVEAMHAEGAVAVCQLVHLGRETLGAQSYRPRFGGGVRRHRIARPAHAYLLEQFLSPRTNPRGDGGSAGRIRQRHRGGADHVGP